MKSNIIYNGRFKVQVINRGSLEIVKELPWKNNMITDFGLNSWNNRLPRTSVQFCAVGTDGTPNVIDSEAITATQSGTVVTASASIFTASDVGRLFKFDSGEESYITSYAGVTEVEVTDSQTIAGATLFAIWKVNDNSLGNFIANSIAINDIEDYFPSTTIRNGTSVTTKKIYYIPISGGTTIREIGGFYVSPTNLTSRAVIDGGLFVESNQDLLITYELVTSYGDSSLLSPQSGIMNITGWPIGGASTTDGDFMLVNMGYQGLSDLNLAIESTQNYLNDTEHDVSPFNDPTLDPAADGLRLYYSTSADALPSFPLGTDILDFTNSGGVAAYSSYVNGSFTQNVTFTVGGFDMNSSSIRKLAITWDNVLIWAFRFDENQTKQEGDELTLIWKWTWGRVLVNP